MGMIQQTKSSSSIRLGRMYIDKAVHSLGRANLRIDTTHYQSKVQRQPEPVSLRLRVSSCEWAMDRTPYHEIRISYISATYRAR